MGFQMTQSWRCSSCLTRNKTREVFHTSHKPCDELQGVFSIVYFWDQKLMVGKGRTSHNWKWARFFFAYHETIGNLFGNLPEKRSLMKEVTFKKMCVRNDLSKCLKIFFLDVSEDDSLNQQKWVANHSTVGDWPGTMGVKSGLGSTSTLSMSAQKSVEMIYRSIHTKRKSKKKLKYL